MKIILVTILLLVISNVGILQVFGEEGLNQNQENNQIIISESENINQKNEIEIIEETAKIETNREQDDDKFEQKSITWNIGIFAIIASAITFIGILLTIRFVYIDKTHDDAIKKTRDDRESAISNQENMLREGEFDVNNIRWFAEYISAFYITIEQYERYRKDNSYYGIRIDVISMAVLFTIGAFATTGIFENMFLVLIMIVAIALFFPIVHFAFQLDHLRTKFSFNHS